MPNSLSRPNVIFVLTDDQGYGDVSCHGNPVLRTPHMDHLHSESVCFTDFHVCPVCTPTRGELLTGRDAIRNGATFVCMGRSLLQPDLPTLADLFSDNGYATGHFGKWHLGDNYPYRPQDRGFQETFYHPAWGITSAPDYFENDYFDAHYRHADEIEQVEGYCTDVWFRLATDWIRECARQDEPFFAYIATNAPHNPLWVPDEYRQPYLGSVNRDHASFFGMIANIDDNLGSLDAMLREEGLRDNTILIYMTDNGTATGESVFNAGMRGKKASLYDGGHRVPFFMRWPAAGIEGGRDIPGLTRGTDLLPTLAELCGLPVPEDMELDGVSLADAARGTGVPPADRVAVIQFGHRNEGTWCYTEPQNAAVLWQQWRLVNGTELYDIETDPGQENDISAEYGDIRAQLRAVQNQWWQDVGENLEKYHPIIIGTDHENPMRLTSCDWAWVYCDNQHDLRKPVMDSGTWHLDVAQAGQYRFELLRWPAESGLGIASPAPEFQGVDGKIQAGHAIPATAASIHIADKEQRQAVPEGAQSVHFETDLDAGPTTLKTWWYDDQDTPLAGAYYVTVERLSLP